MSFAMRVTSRICILLTSAAALVSSGCQPDPDPTAPPASASHELRRGLGADPETLDPRQAVDNAALAVVGDLYEGLATESRDGAIGPGAAESWQVSPDGLEWSIRLRPGLRWSNGDVLTAADFARSLRASIAPDSDSPYAGLLVDLRAIATPAPDRIALTLTRPLPYLPALLSLPLAAPLHQSAATLDPPPSNGPYRLLRWRHGERIELERNPYYRAAAHVQFERVTYRPVADLTTELNLYRTGELDLTSEVPNTQLRWLREHLPGELKIDPYLSTYAYAVNLRRLPDRAAREALAMAIDRERITSLVTGAGEQPAYRWVPAGLAGYPGAAFRWRAWPPDKRTAEARALWQTTQRRAAAPRSITLCTDASANHHRTAVAIADQWHTALGIEVRLVELEWTVYLATRTHPGDCDLVRLGWSADFADAEAFAAVFESRHPQNTLGYASSEYDSLLARSRSTTDAVERAHLLSQAEAVLLEEVPVIPLFHRVSKRLVKPQVAGYHANPLGHLPSRDLGLVDPRGKK